MQKRIDVLKAIINDGGSATFATITAIVSQKMDTKKSGNPLFGQEITKLTEYHVLLNANYSNMVNNQLQREGKEADFKAQQNWHVKVFDGVNGSLVAKRSDMSCMYIMFANLDSKTDRYFIDGKEANKDEVELIKFWRAKTVLPTNQGTDKPIIIRTVKVEGIKSIKANKVEWYDETFK